MTHDNTGLQIGIHRIEGTSSKNKHFIFAEEINDGFDS